MKKLLSALAVTIIIGGVGKAIADGIPTVQPLTYSGVLQTSTGVAITTTQSVQLTLWDDVVANGGANLKCTTPSALVSPDSHGRFRIVLDQTCLGAVKANPNLWIEVVVGGIPLLPRSKLSTVPYAVESDRAQSAASLTGQWQPVVLQPGWSLNSASRCRRSGDTVHLIFSVVKTVPISWAQDSSAFAFTVPLECTNSATNIVVPIFIEGGSGANSMASIAVLHSDGRVFMLCPPTASYCGMTTQKIATGTASFPAGP